MSAAGVGNLCYMDLEILKWNVLTSAEKISLENEFTFQLDNDSKHTSKLCEKWWLYYVKQPLQSTPQLPDLNPIELLCEEIIFELNKYDTKNKIKLKRTIHDICSNISPET